MAQREWAIRGLNKLLAAAVLFAVVFSVGSGVLLWFTSAPGWPLTNVVVEWIVLLAGSYWVARWLLRGVADLDVRLALASWYVGSRVGLLIAWASIEPQQALRSAANILSLGLLPVAGGDWSVGQAVFALAANLLVAGLVWSGLQPKTQRTSASS